MAVVCLREAWFARNVRLTWEAGQREGSGWGEDVSAAAHAPEGPRVIKKESSLGLGDGRAGGGGDEGVPSEGGGGAVGPPSRAKNVSFGP